MECARSLWEPATPLMGSAALSWDLAAPWVPSSTRVLPPAPAPPTVCSGGGWLGADGAAASETFFFGGILMKMVKIYEEDEDLARKNTGSGSHNFDAPLPGAPEMPGLLIHGHLWDRGPFLLPPP